MRWLLCGAALAGCALFVIGRAAAANDSIELKSGKVYEGKLIERTDASVTFQVILPGGANLVAKFPADQVKSVHKAGEAEPPKNLPDGGTKTGGPGPAAGARTEAEIVAAIDKAGKTAPEWWDKVELSYPNTLDLTGVKVTRGPQENLQMYMGAVILPDPAKWKEGVKLLAYVVTVRKDDKPRLVDAMGQLGAAYYSYLRDYERAAFWWRAAIDKGYTPYPSDLAALALCYARLGSKAMGIALLKKYQLDTRASDASVVRAWALLGEIDTAKAVADKVVPTGGRDAAYLRCGHALRSAGEYEAAVECYQKAIDVQGGNARTKERAQLALDATKALAKADLANLPDGTYAGSSKGFRDEVAVEIVVKDKRIASAKVTKHRDDAWFYNRASGSILPRIVENQGLKDVDTVTGATFSSEGILNATAKALGSAVK